MTFLRSVLANRKALFGAVLSLMFVGMAAFGPWFVGDPDAFLASPHQPPSTLHWFGTTGQGQDVFAQTIAGARTTLTVAFVAGSAKLILMS